MQNLFVDRKKLSRKNKNKISIYSIENTIKQTEGCKFDGV
jgi:hypothetical protein